MATLNNRQTSPWTGSLGLPDPWALMQSGLVPQANNATNTGTRPLSLSNSLLGVMPQMTPPPPFQFGVGVGPGTANGGGGTANAGYGQGVRGANTLALLDALGANYNIANPPVLAGGNLNTNPQAGGINLANMILGNTTTQVAPYMQRQANPQLQVNPLTGDMDANNTGAGATQQLANAPFQKAMPTSQTPTTDPVQDPVPEEGEQGLFEMLGEWGGIGNLTGASLLGFAGNALGTWLGGTVMDALGLGDKEPDPMDSARDMLSLSKSAMLNTNAAGAMGQSAQRQAEIALAQANEAGADAVFARAGQRGLADKMLSSTQAQNAAASQMAQRQAGGMQRDMMSAARMAGGSPAAMMAIAREGGAQAGQNALALQAQAGQTMGNAIGASSNILGSADQSFDAAVNSRYQRNVQPRLNDWHDMSGLAISGLNSGTSRAQDTYRQNSATKEGLSIDPLGYLNSAMGQDLGFINTRQALSHGKRHQAFDWLLPTGSQKT